MFSRHYLSSNDDAVKMDPDDENQFVVDDVSKMARDVIEGVLGTNVYLPEKVNHWTASISEQCLGALSKMKKPFKYVITCTITQRSGAGSHTACSYYWDNATDGSCTVRWENAAICCVLSVFGVAI